MWRFATAGAVVAGLTALGAAASAQSTFDPLRLVREDRVVQGPYKGGYLKAPAGQLNWYFANLGLRAFVRDVGPDVRTYLNLYVAHLRPDRTIRDVNFRGRDPQQPVDTLSDSDDSYAATFISLAVAYARASGDRAWFTAALPVIRDVAARNLIRPRNAQGLTYNLQQAPTPADPRPRAALLEDNCEVYRALRDLADYLASVGDQAGARTYAAEAATTLRGIETLFDPATNTWWVSAQHAPTSPTACYPGPVSQVFADAYGVPAPAAWRAAGYAYLNAHFAAWTGSLCPPVDGFPWAVLGYVAAVRHDAPRARAKLAHLERLGAQPTPAERARLAIHELGWYRRTADALGSGSPTPSKGKAPPG